MNNIEEKLDIINSKLDKLLKKYDNIPKQKSSPSTEKKSIINYSKMKVIIYKYADKLLVKGDTYDIRSSLQKYKAYWSPENKGWIIKLNNFSKLEKLLISFGIKPEIKIKNRNLEGNKINNTPQKKTSSEPDTGDCLIISSDED